MNERTVPLRLVVVRPPAGVALAVQSGRGNAFDLVAPSAASADAVTFDLTVRVTEDDPPVVRGELAQGPPAGRFLYVNWGTSAGQAGSPWTRRAKIPLAGVTRALIDALDGTAGGVLRARIAGTDRRGEPACATVRLLDDGWAVETAR